MIEYTIIFQCFWIISYPLTICIDFFYHIYTIARHCSNVACYSLNHHLLFFSQKIAWVRHRDTKDSVNCFPPAWKTFDRLSVSELNRLHTPHSGPWVWISFKNLNWAPFKIGAQLRQKTGFSGKWLSKFWKIQRGDPSMLKKFSSPIPLKFHVWNPYAIRIWNPDFHETSD